MYLSASGNVYALINYIQISYWIAIGGAIGALFYFRRSMPDAPRPIKVHLFWPTLFMIGCIALVIIPSYAAPHDSGSFYLNIVGWETLSENNSKFSRK